MNFELLKKPRVVLANDSERILKAATRVLTSQCEVEIVRAVQSGALAIDAVMQLNPDVVILDVYMPVMDGIQAVRYLRKIASPTKIVFLTGLCDPGFRNAAMEAGGDAFVCQSQLFTDLPLAISAVLAGHTFLSSAENLS
jgi:DNA-binding NarL/FixJ family response regulator